MMQEILNAVAENLATASLAGNAALVLALIPAQFIVDLGKNKIQDFIDQVLPYHPEEVFYDAFLKTLEDHKKQHDQIAGHVATRLIRQLKGRKTHFYHCVNSLQVPQAFARSSEPFPAQPFAEKLIEECQLYLPPEDQEILCAIIRDCMNHYRQTVYRLMNEKGLLLQAMQSLINLQDWAALFETMLSNTATQTDILILKDALLTAIRQTSVPEFQEKTLAEYDQMILSQYCYIEFTAGFSPRINARDIRMKMSDVFINLECMDQKQAVKREFDMAAIVLHNRFNVFLGDPGCGKTTLLKKIAFDIASPENRSGGLLSSFIPLYFRLADYSRFYQSTHKGIAEYLQQTFYQHRKALFDITQRERSLIFLMDGLDEIADTPLRIQVVEQVNTFVFANPQYIYFISSRIVGYQDAALNGIFSTYRLEPLSDDKIRAFVYQWHLAVEENTDDGKSEKAKKEAAETVTQNLIDAIEKNSSVKKLATNPLLLTIITLIHLQGGRLPNKRVELYDICAETFLQHWINRRVDNADAILDRDILIELLSRVAFYIHENYANGLIPEDVFQQQFLQYYQELFDGQGYSLPELKRECRQFIDFIRKETGIFAEKGQDEDGKNLFGFLHLTFEEYFAAIEFKRRVVQNALDLRDYIPSARWREIILLCAALFGGQSGTGRYDASQFVRKILRGKELFPPMHQNLRLALSVMADDVRLLPDCERSIWGRLETVLQENSKLRLRYELETLISSAEYRDRLRKKTKQWLDRGGMMYIQTVNWLIKCEDNSLEELLLTALDYPDFSQALEWLALHGGWPYYQRNKKLLQKMANKIVIYLNNHSDDSEVRWEMLMRLGTIIYRNRQKPQEELASEKDRLALYIYSYVYIMPRDFHYQLGGDRSAEQIKNDIAEITTQIEYTPKIIIHQEVPDMKREKLSQTSFAPFTINGNQHYYLTILISDRHDLYEYIVFDAFLKEIQIGTYTAPLTMEMFVQIFDFDMDSLNQSNLWFDDFINIEDLSNKTDLLQAWENGRFGNWDRLFWEKETSSAENTAFAAEVRKWIKAHGQKNPIHLLLAQMTLDRYEPEKKHITQKALNDAIAYYVNGQIPKGQQDEAYIIIEKAVQAKAPNTKRTRRFKNN